MTVQTAVKADSQQAGIGQLALQHVHHAVLTFGVEGVGSFLDKHPGRSLQKQSRHAQSLLGTQRQHPIPTIDIAQPRRQPSKAGTLQRMVQRLGTEVVGSETNLKPNTKHIFEAYNQGAGAAAPLFIQIECYEGKLDLPL